VLTAINLEVM